MTKELYKLMKKNPLCLEYKLSGGVDEFIAYWKVNYIGLRQQKYYNGTDFNSVIPFLIAGVTVNGTNLFLTFPLEMEADEESGDFPPISFGVDEDNLFGAEDFPFRKDFLWYLVREVADLSVNIGLVQAKNNIDFSFDTYGDGNKEFYLAFDSPLRMLIDKDWLQTIKNMDSTDFHKYMAEAKEKWEGYLYRD